MRTLRPVEDERFYYDADAAERPIRFIQGYCRHWEGQWAGKNLVLLDWQKECIRTLYGWKDRRTKLRRFRELYLLTAKGAGKTPMFSAIGQYELFAGGEPAAHVVSMATDFKQSYLTMEWAKNSISQDAKLSKLADVTQFEIRNPKTKSKWTTLSGTFAGRAGFRPSLILADEAHEWPSGRLYANVIANMAKRREPLLLVATNAGPNRHCFCWELHEQAVRVLDGKSDRTDLLPVICEADPKADWTSEEAAAQANPSLGSVITFDALKPIVAKAKESSGDEAIYRRLYLSQWHAGGNNKWLDINLFDRQTKAFTAADVKGFPLYLSLDMSLNDDLSALVYTFVGEDRLFVKCHQWIPKVKAHRYQDRDGMPFDRWATAGNVTLADSETIDHHVHTAIVRRIRKAAKRLNLRSLSYDAAWIGGIVPALERHGITCIPVSQKAVVLHPACQELERRLTAGTVQFAPNELLRAQAVEVELWSDTNGNTRPVKEGSKGKYAGTKSKKIDGIAALVTGWTSVLRDMATGDDAAIDYKQAITLV